MKLILLLLITLSLVGCAITNKLYKGPERPASQLSIINQLYMQEVVSNSKYYQFRLRKVDGKSISVSVSDGIGGVELIPGKHTFTYEIEKITSLLPSTIYVNKKHYDFTVTTMAGMKGFVAFKTIDGGSELCMYFSDIDKSYPFLTPQDFLPNKKYKPTCTDVGVNHNDASWIKRL